MFKNYLTIALRNLWRNKTFSLINIFGLALGMALSILMFMYVYQELTFDGFHQNKNEIYRVLLKQESSAGESTLSAIASAAVGPTMLLDFPEIRNMVRLSNPTGGFFISGESAYKVNRISYADSSFFNVFSFNLIHGNPDLALTEPFSAVLTEETARKIFGNKNPIGQMISLNNEDKYRVTGLVENPPAYSSIRYDVLLSFSTLYTKSNIFLGWDGGFNYYTYLLLNTNSSVEHLTSGFPDFMEEQINQKYRDVGWFVTLLIEPLKDIHLHSAATYDLSTKGSLSRIYIFASIAIFILLIACVNFINLSTARSIKRAKEIGMRKVVGATKKQLIGQFLGESVLLSLFALIIALLFIEIIQPEFSQLLTTDLDIFQMSQPGILLTLLIITLFVGLVAGIFPAFYMSGFKPVSILKGYFTSNKGTQGLRNILVTFQFFIAVVLMISTIVILLQLRFLNNQNLGFNKDNLIIVELGSENAMKKVNVIKNEISRINGVSGIAASTSYPGLGLTMNGYFPEGSNHAQMFHVMDVDFDYVDLMKLQIIDGRNFSRDFGTDSSAFIINETLAKQLGWDKPVGKYISRDGKHQVIGVVKDFNFASLHNTIGPLILTIKPWDFYYYLSVKVPAENQEQTIKDMETAWTKMIPDEVFNYYFLDSEINSNYESEKQTATAFIWLAIIAIVIGCLGLYGQAAFSVSQRTKEIGVRKVFGATTKNIFGVLTSSFTRIVIIANILAWPVAWYFMSRWLENFAFHVQVYWWIFVLVFLISLLITTATIVTQTIKASYTQIVGALKYE